jgi:glycosyltransferase involved in cell wall biosynthesis
MALPEAMACGCYCVGHCWKGIEEILPLENIYVTDAELRAKLVGYAALADPQRRRLQTQMRAIAEDRFDERRMAQEIASIIEQIASQYGGSGEDLAR